MLEPFWSKVTDVDTEYAAPYGELTNWTLRPVYNEEVSMLFTAAPVTTLDLTKVPDCFKFPVGQNLVAVLNPCVIAKLTTAGGGFQILFVYVGEGISLDKAPIVGRIEFFFGKKADGTLGLIHAHFHGPAWTDLGDRPATMEGYKEGPEKLLPFIRFFFQTGGGNTLRLALLHTAVGDEMFTGMTSEGLSLVGEQIIESFQSPQGEGAWMGTLEGRSDPWDESMRGMYNQLAQRQAA